MNSKTAKKLRRFAKLRGIPEKALKRVYKSMDLKTRSKINQGVMNDR